MSAFRDALGPVAGGDRTWIYVPYDQLTDRIGPLSRLEPCKAGIVLVESLAKPRRRPYHKQKLAWILASMRHFAVEQAKRGVAVDYRMSDASYADVLATVVQERGCLVCMRPAERELRAELAPLVARGDLSYVEHDGWLSTREDFEGAGKPPYRQDAFYRAVRQRTGVLMEDGKPVGGQYSFDGDNREPWKGAPKPPEMPRYEVDAITREVGDLLTEGPLADHPGTLDLETIPASAEQVKAHWDWVLAECMTHFGTYEDAMTTESRGLFHTRISPLLNLHRLLPERVVSDVESADIPLNSKEGFIRQVLGWREFVRHVHEITDGFRVLPGDDGFTGHPFDTPTTGMDDGASPAFFGAEAPLPPAFWPGAPSGLTCLDTVVEDVWAEGYSHHITRLMVLSNLARLLDYSPRELTDWFWIAYIDAFDWVVEPNVLGMGTFAVGEVMTTKPYISGANYIDKMSDYCRSCAFHPKKTCPITPLYWSFLHRNREALSGVDRARLQLRGLGRRKEAQLQTDARIFEWVRSTLEGGARLRPEDVPQ